MSTFSNGLTSDERAFLLRRYTRAGAAVDRLLAMDLPNEEDPVAMVMAMGHPIIGQLLLLCDGPAPDDAEVINAAILLAAELIIRLHKEEKM